MVPRWILLHVCLKPHAHYESRLSHHGQRQIIPIAAGVAHLVVIPPGSEG